MAEPKHLGHQVLVVDDDTDLAAVICDFLNGTGLFRAEHVGDGEAALEAWESGFYDLVIVDYAMPGMDGLQLISALHGSRDIPVPAIIMSGKPVGDVALRSGAAAFLEKPFPMSRLLDELVTVLGLDH
jgi:CheY-like chemotaxis protein